MTKHDIKSDYLGCVYDVKKRQQMVSYAVKQLKLVTDLFDFFVFRGTSGLLMGPEIAGRLKKPFSVIRKKNDNAHYLQEFEGALVTGGRYIVIDDFICSGTTLDIIVEAITKIDPTSVYVGCYLYKPKICIKSAMAWNFDNAGHYMIGPFVISWDNEHPLSPKRNYSKLVTMSNHRERMLAKEQERKKS